MTYKTYNRQMLADFTGRPVASFPDSYVSMSAIPQALLLFKLGTCLASPDDLNDEDRQLVDFAILSMADAIHLAAPYQTALASPFNTESIGSYSYSKVARAVQKQEETGVMWFDMAIDRLSVCDDALLSGFAMGGVEVFEHDGPVLGRLGNPNNSRFLSPQDIDAHRRFEHDPRGTFGIPQGGGDDGTGGSGGRWVEDPQNPGVYIWSD